MNTYDWKDFSYEAANRTFTAEASALAGGSRSPFGRVYPDACDEGLVIRGRGAEIAYAVTEVKRDNDNDLMYWKLTPTPESLRRVPAARGTSVVVLND